MLKVNCRNNTASLLRLQFFNWLIKSLSLQKLIEEKLAHQTVFTLELIHLDPMVNLALRYAFADGLVSMTDNSKYRLTEKGREFANRILGDSSILGRERELLVKIGQRVSEVRLRQELL